MVNKYSVLLEFLVNSNSHLVFKFKGKIKFIAVKYACKCHFTVILFDEHVVLVLQLPYLVGRVVVRRPVVRLDGDRPVREILKCPVRIRQLAQQLFLVVLQTLDATLVRTL
jgi:hypothetical protein